MRVHDELEGLPHAPEVEQRDARDIARVGERLERRDRRRPRLGLGAKPLDHPRDLVTAVVVPEAPSVRSRTAELRHVSRLREVPAHPVEPLRVGERGNQLVVRIGARDTQRDERQLLRRLAVVARIGTLLEDAPGNLQPALSECPRRHDLHGGHPRSRLPWRSELGRGTTPHEARSHRLGVRSYPRTARAIAERLRARRLLASLVRALRLQALGAAAATPAVERCACPPRAGRERRGDRSRRGSRRRVQGGVAQPPVRRRAVPGRGDRRRRDPPRHRGDGSTADRIARRPPLRRTGLALSPGGRRHRPLRQLRRRPERRRRVRLRRGLRRKSARERDVRRLAADRARAERPCAGARQRARPLRGVHRSRRDRRRIGARLPGSRGLGRETAVGADRRSVPRQGVDRGLARARRTRARALVAGLRRRRARLLALRDGARRSASTCTSTGCPCARPISNRGRS